MVGRRRNIGGRGAFQSGRDQTFPGGLSVRSNSCDVARAMLTPPEKNSASITLMRLPSRTIRVCTSTGEKSGSRYMSTVSRDGM